MPDYCDLCQLRLAPYDHKEVTGRYQQSPRSSRRNALPVKRRNGSLLMGREYLARAVVELMPIRKPSSGPDRVLHHAPKAFDGVEVVPTRGREEMEVTRAMVVVESRVELVRPRDPVAIDDHDDVFAGFAEGRHDLMEILASFLRITGGHDFIEDFRGAIRDGADDAAQHTAGDATPRAVL